MTAPLETKLERYLRGSPFVAFMGLELSALEPEAGRLALTMRLKPEFERSAGHTGRWHGGVVAALADTAGDFALIMSHDAPPPTINIRLDYLRPVVGPSLTATATVRKAGRTVSFVDIDVTTHDGTLVAIARGNYATGGLQPSSGPSFDKEPGS